MQNFASGPVIDDIDANNRVHATLQVFSATDSKANKFLQKSWQRLGNNIIHNSDNHHVIQIFHDTSFDIYD